MCASGGVDALVGEHEPFHRIAVHHVRFDDLIDIIGRDPPVPNGVGVDHDRGSVLALIKTARHIRAHALLQPTQREFLLEEELEVRLPGGIAASARMSRLALIAADEQMPFELGHGIKCNGFPDEKP